MQCANWFFKLKESKTFTYKWVRDSAGRTVHSVHWVHSVQPLHSILAVQPVRWRILWNRLSFTYQGTKHHWRYAQNIITEDKGPKSWLKLSSEPYFRWEIVMVACVAWRFLSAQSNKGGRGQWNREEIGEGATCACFCGFAALSCSRQNRHAMQAIVMVDRCWAAR